MAETSSRTSNIYRLWSYSRDSKAFNTYIAAGASKNRVQRTSLPPAFRPLATNSSEFVDTSLFGVSTCNNIQPLDTPTSHGQTCDWVAFPEKLDPTPPVLHHSSHYREILERLSLCTAVILHAHVHWTALSYRPFVSCMCCSLASKHNSHAVKCFLNGWANPLSGLARLCMRGPWHATLFGKSSGIALVR